jgi:hypothetical protein
MQWVRRVRRTAEIQLQAPPERSEEGDCQLQFLVRQHSPLLPRALRLTHCHQESNLAQAGREPHRLI